MTLNYHRVDLSKLYPLHFLDLYQRHLGDVDYGQSYPIYGYCTWKQKPQRPVIVLTALVHGDEPAGFDAAGLFTQRSIEKYKGLYDFFIVPCVNPSGQVQGKRENQAGQDINRNFTLDSFCQEARMIISYVMSHNIRPVLCIDLHEDRTDQSDGIFDIPTGFYLYEMTRHKSLIGPTITKALRTTFTVTSQTEIYGEKAVEGCVVSTQDQDDTVEAFFFRRGAQVALTLETPTCWKLETRIAAQVQGIEEAIKAFDILEKT
ncbi:succinylglutamate desuccinylase/aspartoacylase family protein [Candidatus Woesearchaeota archaeon]|nr:succinylglutamate desuccinylase/aspartoacylase family protein [Candidatus Woesearchaeota archaeon]